MPLAVERTAAALHCAANLVLLLHMWDTSSAHAPWQCLRQAAVVVASSALLWLSLGGQRQYSLHRLYLVPILRLAAHTVVGAPSLPAAFSGVQLLDRAPMPRSWGAINDTIQVLVGTGLLGNALPTLLFPLPLPLATATHVAAVLSTRDNERYCRSQLLSHPITQSRLRWLWVVLDTSTLAATPMGTSISTVRGRMSAQLRCQLTLTFLQGAFCLLPVAMLAWLQQPPPAGGGSGLTDDGSSSRGGGRRRGDHARRRRREQQQQQLPSAPAASFSRLWWQEAWQGADDLIRTACFCRYGWMGRASGMAWLLVVLWLALKAGGL